LLLRRGGVVVGVGHVVIFVVHEMVGLLGRGGSHDEEMVVERFISRREHEEDAL
jgi:hypothetical protein